MARRQGIAGGGGAVAELIRDGRCTTFDLHGLRLSRFAEGALTMETARKRDAGEGVTLEAAASKYFASEMVGRVADRAVQIFGGAGYVADYGIERFYRDVRIFRIYEGTSQIQQLVVARETMKRGG